MAHEIRNYISPYEADSYWDYLNEDRLTLALFMKITPSTEWADLPTLGYTSLDYPLTLSAHSLTFYPSAGLLPSTIESEASKPSNLEMGTVFDLDITESDILAGKWNGAKIELWRMNYEALGMGEEVLFSGIISTITNQQDTFKAELVGLSSRMDGNFGHLTSRICRKVGTFTDFPGACGYSEASSGGFLNQRTLTVSTVTDKTHISLTRSTDDVPDDFYTNGKMECLTGDNEGISREIQAATGVGTETVDVVLKRPFPLSIDAGDTFKMTVGCDGTLQRCVYFDNVVNRSAEDFIPGISAAAKVPSH